MHAPIPQRRRSILVIVLAMLAALAVALPGLASLSGSSFDADDGNLTPSAGKVDWNSFTDPATAAAFDFRFQTDLSNDSDDDIYRPSMTHDVGCPDLDSKKEQNKSDFTRFYIAQERDNGGDTFVHVAWQRIRQNSITASGHASFIFAQSEALCPNGVTPVRTSGDMLFKYDFEGGSAAPELAISRWIDGTEGKTAADCEVANTLPCWEKQRVLDANEAVGAANHRDIPNDPECPRPQHRPGTVWDALQGKCLETVEFGEASVNMNAAGIFTEDDCVSFGSVHVASRASGNSFNATLKDLIRPLGVTISNCGSLTVTKVADASNPDDEFDFTLTNGGALPEDCDANFSLKHGESETCDDLFAGTYTVTELDPTPEYELESIVCTGTHPDNVTVDLDTRSVAVDLAADDVVTCTFTNERQPGSIVVYKLDEEGNFLPGAGFTVAPANLDGETQLVKRADGVFCIDNLAQGDYTVTETTVPDGYTGAAPANVTVNSASTCADRIAADDGADATFENVSVPGQIDILKEDDLGNPMEGVRFELFEDEDGEKGAATGMSCTTGSDGTCSITDIPLGDYWLDETNLPDGYSPDDDLPKAVTIGLGGAPGEGQTLSFEFVNPQLHHVIVIVCHSGTNTLAPSEYHNGDETDTLVSISAAQAAAAGLDVGALCGLDSFGGLDHGEKDLTVDVGSNAHE